MLSCNPSKALKAESNFDLEESNELLDPLINEELSEDYLVALMNDLGVDATDIHEDRPKKTDIVTRTVSKIKAGDDPVPITIELPPASTVSRKINDNRDAQDINSKSMSAKKVANKSRASFMFTECRDEPQSQRPVRPPRHPKVEFVISGPIGEVKHVSGNGTALHKAKPLNNLGNITKDYSTDSLNSSNTNLSRSSSSYVKDNRFFSKKNVDSDTASTKTSGSNMKLGSVGSAIGNLYRRVSLNIRSKIKGSKEDKEVDQKARVERYKSLIKKYKN
ncbi:hypothetical protein MP638_003661 [Amoeboaphelidium occidentale]|nr:hypothetical protein MP638_003661 [Amoeboaphelidium occidentale]